MAAVVMLIFGIVLVVLAHADSYLFKPRKDKDLQDISDEKKPEPKDKE